MKIIVYVLIAVFISQTGFSQDIFVYHGLSGETKIFDSNKKQVSIASITKSRGESIVIEVLNPNPLFYTYEFSYEEQKDVSEDQSLTSALSEINNALLSRTALAGAGITAGTPAILPDRAIDEYFETLNKLNQDINDARQIIQNSESPETPNDALAGVRNKGLRNAKELLQRLPSSQYRFNSATLLADLNTLKSKISAANLAVVDDAFGMLNAKITNEVKEIKDRINKAKTTITKKFVVTEKRAKLFLIIKPTDASSKTLTRDYQSGDEKIEIANISVFYDRATIELVPVGTLIFAQGVSEFYLKDNNVQERKIDKTNFSTGLVVNVNVKKFGDLKEMAFGVGLGYKLSNESNSLSNFYFSTLYSYKNFLRIGFGLGVSQFPGGLEQGATIGQPLPANVTNINDIVSTTDKLSGFLTFSFTGLNLKK